MQVRFQIFTFSSKEVFRSGSGGVFTSNEKCLVPVSGYFDSEEQAVEEIKNLPTFIEYVVLKAYIIFE